jgi:triosephosphate isomerase
LKKISSQFYKKRTPIVAMSYKNYLNKPEEVGLLVEEIILGLKESKTEFMECFLFPSMGTIETVARFCKGSNLGFGAQNIAPQKNGAYTGEFSIESLIALGGRYVELGHFERKTLFFETNQQIKEKIHLTLSESMIPVLCIGETIKCEGQMLEEILMEQLKELLSEINEEKVVNVILAYEPGWAIGQAKPASIAHIHRSHTCIRRCCERLFTKEIAEHIRIIYGGSVSLTEVSEIVDHQEVDGVFVGRFGHEVNQFLEIIQRVSQMKEE